MDWREVFKGFYAVGGKWEGDGLVPSKGARLLIFFVSVYPLTYIYRFGFYMKILSYAHFGAYLSAFFGPEAVQRRQPEVHGYISTALLRHHSHA